MRLHDRLHREIRAVEVLPWLYPKSENVILQDLTPNRFSVKGVDLAALAKRIVEGGKVRESDLRSGGRGRRIAESRRLFCQLAVKKMGYPGAEVGRFLGVTTSAVNKAASSAEVSEIGKYL